MTNSNSKEATLQQANKYLLGMCLGVMTFWLFALAMTPLGPAISKSLNLSPATISLPIGFSGLVSAILIVPAGVLADRYGCLKMFRISILCAIAGALLCGLALNQTMLISGRLLQGCSAALVMPSTLALVKTYFCADDQPRALSFWSMSSFGSAGLCSFFGGFIETLLGWRWVFLLAIPIALLALYFLSGAPESQRYKQQDSRFDRMGFTLILFSLLAINLAITRGAVWGWNHPLTLLCFFLFFILLPLFIYVEKKHISPVIDLHLFNNKVYNSAVIANFLLNSGLGAMYILFTYLQQGRGLSSFDATLMTLSYLVVILLMIRVGEKLAHYFGARLPMCVGALSAALGYSLMACTFIPGPTYYFAVVLGFAFMGLGNGIFATPATTIAVRSAPTGKVGSATAIFKMASSLGGSLGIAIYGALYHGILSVNPDNVERAGQNAIGLCALALLIASLISFINIPGQKQSLQTN
ncbi:MAG: MFS transporter [Enterobacteriaceae bacterium]